MNRALRPLWMLSGSLAIAAAIGSCAHLPFLHKQPKKKEDSPFGPGGIPPELRAKTPSGGTPVTPGGNT